MSTTLSTAPAIVRAGSLADSIKVEPLTCSIGALLSNVNLGVASRDSALVAEIRALLLKHRVLFFRDQDISRAEHVAFARHFGELEDHPVAGSDPENPGLVRIYKSPGAAQRPLREQLAHRRHLAREAALRLRAALRRMPAGRRRHDVGQHGAGLREAARAHQDADRRPARPPQHRGQLRRRHADRQAPGAARAVPGCRAPGGAHAPRDRREGAVRQRLHDALHQLPQRRERARRPGLRAGREPAAAVPDQPGADPRVPGALALAAEQRGHVGQPLAPSTTR